MTPQAWIDGRLVPLHEAALPLLTDGLLRGDGGFETIGVWSGRPFRLESHLDRLDASLAALELPPPDRPRLHEAVDTLLAGAPGEDAALRCYVLAGGAHIVTLDAQPVRPDIASLSTQPAPWIRPLGSYGPAGAKTLSYAPNMAALRRARAAGADDALLVSLEGWVLEGTTFAVLWVRDGVLRAPDLELGVIDSISRGALLEMAADQGIAVEQGRWPLADLHGADEVLVSSSVRPCTAIRRVDDRNFDGPGPVCRLLAPLLEAARRQG
jgi:branched-subunit amino acid aminotransferase/4-amino-4-deoxychorismate lyase